MQQTILFKATGRSSKSPVVILQGPAISAMCSIPVSLRLSRTLFSICKWMRCNCAPRNILHAVFGEKVSMAVAIIGVIAMWWHIVSIADTVVAGEAIATDCICIAPWGIVWCLRATVSGFRQTRKGGRA